MPKPTANWSETASVESMSSASADLSHEDKEDTVTILGEIVGARNLSVHDDDQEAGVVDDQNLKPYCVVKFGGRVLHKTEIAEEVGCNPIWTVSSRSLFLLQGTTEEICHGTLNITIFSKRETPLPVKFLRSNNVFLGQVHLESLKILSHCDEKRLEVDIEDDMGEETSFLGSLALRFRIATHSDQRFVQLFNANKHLFRQNSQKELAQLIFDNKQGGLYHKGEIRPQARLVTETDEAEIAQSSLFNALNNVFSFGSVRDKVTGAKKVRVKPYPDPRRVESTKYMSTQEIHTETREPSHNWVEAGSGTLGKLYVEILACHNLPNVDMGEAVGNVTDSFVTLVYEDACAMTDVIDDELSPHWLPWSQRAFCFGMMHPASILYLGVFDYDLGIGNHEAIGRVAINVCNLQRNTICTLKYDLYASANVTDRTPNGSITIRLRVECFDEKAALLAALKPRPKIHVNVQKEKSFKVIRYTCFGEYDNEEKFDLTVARSYMNEIFEYKAALSYAFGDTIQSLIFWRGQVEFFAILLPMHSFLFFCAASTLVEKPHMIVPFSLLGVAWIMIANLTVRRQHPSPWNRCPSFWDYLYLLRTGKSTTPVASIKEFEGYEATKAYEEAWNKRLEEDRKVAETRALLQQTINEIGDDNISTKTPGGTIPLDLLVRLTRYQGYAGAVCRYFRFAKIILTWEESVVSFWITFIFLAAGLVSLILPWSFILTWTARLFVWCVFGPHMKFVDLYVRANRRNDVTLQKLRRNFDVQSNVARLRRERALKVKDIKSIAFGKYSIQVPSFNLARHYDRPLPASSARLCRKEPKRREASRRVSVVNLQRTPWIPGQQLFGEMIPRPVLEAKAYEDEAQKSQVQLAKLLKRLKNERDADSLGRFQRLKNKALGFNTSSTSAMGYEIIPECRDSLEERTDEIYNEYSFERLSVVFSHDRSEAVVEENDGKSTYQVAVCATDGSCYEEEGLEVVGLGRYSTLADGNATFALDQVLSSDSKDLVFEDECSQHSRLSQMFKSSPTTDVAFYRPMILGDDHEKT